MSQCLTAALLTSIPQVLQFECDVQQNRETIEAYEGEVRELHAKVTGEYKKKKKRKKMEEEKKRAGEE